MKKYLYSIIVFACICSGACKKLDLAPLNIIQDKDIFKSKNGVEAYMARIYSEMPIEDFKYSPGTGFNSTYYGPFSAITGEAISRDQGSGTETFGYWADGYKLIRECNYFILTLPEYRANFDSSMISGWLGEAHFVRAMTYFALAKRYGGVPIVPNILDYTTLGLENIQLPRSSEEAVYNYISSDLDTAYNGLGSTNQNGRANKYAAAAFKSRVMLFAGSIAKYNKINLYDDHHIQLCGIPASKANQYFQESYNAAKLLEGVYSLYLKTWSKDDKNAQYQNYVNLFLDEGSPENIFIRQYHYPDAVHDYDASNVPRQLWGPGGYSSETNPTLDLVELYDGLPKNTDGTLKNLDASGHYILYDNTLDLFANAEPRLRATVILPGDLFKNENIEIRRGIFTGTTSGGIARILPAGSTSTYPTKDLVTSATADQSPYTLPDGAKMNPAGLSGIFSGNANSVAGCLSGFSVRKWLEPDKPTAEVLPGHSEQSWIEIRYAEVLLNRAEAALELSDAGSNDQNYKLDAWNIINQIRERAGAGLSESMDKLTIDTIRKERRKELAFENKAWWDLRRWRVLDKQQNNKTYRVLMPFYAARAGKYFFDVRFDERNTKYTFDPRWYYEQIPTGTIAKNPKLIQNPGY